MAPNMPHTWLRGLRVGHYHFDPVHTYNYMIHQKNNEIRINKNPIDKFNA